MQQLGEAKWRPLDYTNVAAYSQGASAIQPNLWFFKILFPPQGLLIGEYVW